MTTQHSKTTIRLAKSKSHIIFNDPELNTPHIIHKNIYENFLVTAMKMHYYLRSWTLDLQKSASFIASTRAEYFPIVS